MQMLFQWEMSPQDSRKLEGKFWKAAKAADSTRRFANELFEGASKDAKALDEFIARHVANWKPERLAAIDRAILRLAAYELKTGSTPPKVVLDEAVELAKKFSSEDAAKFVNGVLDAIHKALKIK